MFRFPLRTLFLGFCTSLTASILFAQTVTFGPAKDLGIQTDQADFIDLNGDGNTDLLLLTTYPTVYLGDGKGGFSTTAITLTGGNRGTGQYPFYTDVNGDGFADEVSCYTGFDDGGNTGDPAAYDGVFAVSLGDGNGNLTNTTFLYLSYGNGSSCVEGDFNGDGKPDFALIANASGDDPGPSTLTIFLNKGNGVFTQEQDVLIEDNYIAVGDLAVGDFNGDGKLDLAWGDEGSNGKAMNQFDIHYRYGNGDGTFGADHTYITDGQVFSLASADLNHDGKADLIAGLDAKLDANGKPLSGAQPRIATLLSKSSGGFSWESALSSSNLPEALSIADFNGDSQPDLIMDTSFFSVGKVGGAFTTLQDPGAVGEYSSFAPLKKGGLYDLFTVQRDSNGTYTLHLQLNTSKK